MKALTVSQPWASMLIDGGKEAVKWVENRSWRCGYRGLLAIHAGKGSQYLDKRDLEKFPMGAVIGIVRMTGCEALIDIRNSAPTKVIGSRRVHEILAHKYTEGPYCWIMADAMPLPEPIPTRGAQLLWDWPMPPDVARKLGL